MSWIRVNGKKRCPICDHDDWCSVAQDGSVVCCQRAPSSWPCKGDMGGWIHKLNPDLKQRVKNVFRRAPKKKTLPPVYWHQIWTNSQGKCPKHAPITVLADELGLTANSLDRMLCGWLIEHRAFSFPMWDGSGRMVGIRLRDLSGKKWCVTGSNNGIFWPMQVDVQGDTLLFICEGPTDCAALLDLGFDAIGRPNALGGMHYLQDFLRQGRREVVIMADNDKVHAVGVQGAIRLARQIHTLCNGVSVLQPPNSLKDVREWYNEGGTHEDILRMIR